MTIEEVKKDIIDSGKDPNDYAVFITENGFTVWKKKYAPKWLSQSQQIAKNEDKPIKEDVGTVAETLVLNMDDSEVLADTVVFLFDKIQQLEEKLEELKNG